MSIAGFSVYGNIDGDIGRKVFILVVLHPYLPDVVFPVFDGLSVFLHPVGIGVVAYVEIAESLRGTEAEGGGVFADCLGGRGDKCIIVFVFLFIFIFSIISIFIIISIYILPFFHRLGFPAVGFSIRWIFHPLGFWGVGFITPVGCNQIGSLLLREWDCANVVIEAKEPPVALILDMDALYIPGPFQQGEGRLDFRFRKVQCFGKSLDIQLPLLSQAEHLHIDAQRQRINIAVEDDALAYLLVVLGGFDYAYITSHC